MSDNRKPEIISKRLVHRATMFDVNEEEIRLENGKVLKKGVVRHPGAVVIIPVHQSGNLVLIRQYRHVIDDYIYEFPAGCLNKDEKPFDCAKREIREETGYRADEWHDLGFVLPAPGFCDEKQYLFVAKQLTESRLAMDEDEIIDVMLMSRKGVEQKIVDGEINDSKSISAFARACLAGLI